MPRPESNAIPCSSDTLPSPSSHEDGKGCETHHKPMPPGGFPGAKRNCRAQHRARGCPTAWRACTTALHVCTRHPQIGSSIGAVSPCRCHSHPPTAS
eukprot:2201851-Prymnesium_polylepis.1